MKGCIYYTSSDLAPEILEPCQRQLLRAFAGEIVSVSLKPMDFGKNLVFNGSKSYPTMTRQILLALENSTADYVFFTEHDVLYHPSHFEFTPTRDDIYYYNTNNYRWRYGTDVAVTYDELHSLSGMCCNRLTAIKHYKHRIKLIEDQKLDEDRSREPRWARRFGYEPGTKPIRRGGVSDETFETWKSEFPNIDLRHKGTFSHPKTFAREFHHLPATFREVNVYDIPGWDLKSIWT